MILVDLRRVLSGVGSEADAASRVDGKAVAAIEGKLQTRYVLVMKLKS